MYLASRLSIFKHKKEVIMSQVHFSIKKLISKRAKFYAREKGISLTSARLKLAEKYSFQDLHELTKVIKENSYDLRLYKLAFQFQYPEELLIQDDVFNDIYFYLEDYWSGEIASMNAYDFELYFEDVQIEKYDENRGILSLNTDLSFSGTPDSERMYSGHEIFAKVNIMLNRVGDFWEFNNEESEIVSAYNNTELPGFYNDDY